MGTIHRKDCWLLKGDFVMPSKKINIVHIIPTLNSGGAESVVLGYLKKFQNDSDISLSLLVLGCNNGSIFDREAKKRNLSVEYANLKPSLFRTFKMIKAIRKYVNKEKPDIVHSHLRILPFVTAATLFKKVKRIHTIHTVPSVASNGKIFCFDKFCYKVLKVLPICLNKELSESANTLYDINHCQYLYNPIDIEKFSKKINKAELRKKFNIPENAYVLGHVGRFDRVKNHTFIIDVFSEISKVRSDACLVLIGEGKEQLSIQEKCKALGLDKNVYFLGTRNDVSDILQIMDVFIFPSIHEGLGIALIEAQAAGLKCIASDIIPKEVTVSDKLIFMSLKANPKAWCDEILNDNSVGYKKVSDLNDFNKEAVYERLKHFYFMIVGEGFSNEWDYNKNK